VDIFLGIGSLNREYYRSCVIPDGRICLVPYAVNNDFFRKKAIEPPQKSEESRKLHGLDPGRPVILFASKMIGRKPPQHLLEACVALSPGEIEA